MPRLVQSGFTALLPYRNPNTTQVLTPSADRGAHFLHAGGLLGIKEHPLPVQRVDVDHFVGGL